MSGEKRWWHVFLYDVMARMIVRVSIVFAMTKLTTIAAGILEVLGYLSIPFVFNCLEGSEIADRAIGLVGCG